MPGSTSRRTATRPSSISATPAPLPPGRGSASGTRTWSWSWRARTRGPILPPPAWRRRLRRSLNGFGKSWCSCTRQPRLHPQVLKLFYWLIELRYYAYQWDLISSLWSRPFWEFTIFCLGYPSGLSPRTKQLSIVQIKLQRSKFGSPYSCLNPWIKLLDCAATYTDKIVL